MLTESWRDSVKGLAKRLIIIIVTATIVLTVVLTTPAELSTSVGFIGPPEPPPLTTKSKPPRVFCRSALLVDNSTRHNLYGRKEYTVRPIASITKLLTILTFLDFDVDWNKEIKMIRSDTRNSSKSRFRAGDVYRVRDLFYAGLMSSDNRATRALARSTDLPMDSFIVLLNKKADDLGLLTMELDEVTGLSEKNIASAADCARLLYIASSNPTIKKVMRTRVYRFKSLKRKRTHQLVNTNRLLKSRWYVEGGKTGYIFESGWCLAVRASDHRGHDLTAVILGAGSKSSRFTQASRLLRWGFDELNGS